MKKALNDDIIQLTQIGVERRRRAAEEERADRMRHRGETAGSILSALGVMSVFAGCFAAENSTRTLIAGCLIGCVLIAAALIIDAVTVRR